MKNIGIISTRISGTDGVSLEIEKWATVLERNGYKCFYFAGEIDRPKEKSFIAEEAHFNYPDVKKINENILGRDVRPLEITDLIHSITGKLKSGLKEFVNKYSIDLILPENALTIPMNIPLGIAITEFISETGMPAIAHHHDFSWERERFLVNAVNDFLQMAFPPVHGSIQHAVINSIASASLSFRRGVSSTVVPNVYDFANPPGVSDEKAVKELRSKAGLANDDYFILQPTRVVPRKWIERSIDLVSRMDLSGRKLVISHSSGDEGDNYSKMLDEYSSQMDVELVYLDRLISKSGHGKDDDGFGIGDAYQAADLVMYPSGYEGFGNAFLEAIYYRKPPCCKQVSRIYS